MRIIVTGSIAFDYLMSFPGKFTEHFLPEHMSRVSLSFLVDSMDKRRGGCAPNIAYTLALLGERPLLMATTGQDFDEYRRWLDNLFDGCDAIATIPAPGEAPEGLANTGDATFCSLWTQAALPAVTIPSGRGPRGLPLGVQFVGRYREDERALQVAAWCEGVLGVSLGLASPAPVGPRVPPAP